MSALTTDTESAATAAQFAVVVNDEEQYSVWWADRTVPAGWNVTGFTGTRQECLDHIDAVWTDMRPASLRAFMAEHSYS